MNIDESNPTEWFEDLYSNADKDGNGVPWASMKVHDHFLTWLKKNDLNGKGKKALVIGCGMGDDAIYLEELGFEVTAFDVSKSAIELCQKRFPNSKVNFITSDLFNLPEEIKKGFDFTLEIYTIQALPPKYENEIINNIAELVNKKGDLLIIAVVGKEKRDFKNGPPWVLTEDHQNKFVELGFSIKNQIKKDFEDSHRKVFITNFYKS